MLVSIILHDSSGDGVREDLRRLTAIHEPERVERALKLVGFLKYRLFTQAEADDAPLLTMTLRLRDGTECALSASGDTVWWRGKAHALRQRELFVNLTEGLFFAAD